MSQSLSKIWTHLVFNKRALPVHIRSKRTATHARLFGHNVEGKQLSDINCGRCFRPCACVIYPFQKPFNCQCCLGDQAGLLKMGKRGGNPIEKVSLAGGLRCILRKFHWQEGYGAFSISQSHIQRVQKYILNQERHHRRKTFKDEFRALLTKYEIEYDERYVWD